MTTRVLSALNQVVTFGSQNQGLDQLKRPYTLEVYVTRVSIKVSVQNGASITNVTESGVVYQSSNASK